MNDGTDKGLPEGYKYYLEMENTLGTPSIRIFPKDGNDKDYLSDQSAAESQIRLKALGTVSADQPLLINPNVFRGKTEEFLFEGLNYGQGILHLTLRGPNGSLVSEDKVYLTLRDMFPVADFRSCTGPDMNPNTCIIWPADGFSQDTTLKKQKVTVFVHGYGVDEAGGGKAFETVFRRLYWSGVTNPSGPSDFIGLTWFGDEGIEIFGKNPFFNRNVFNAFQASIPVGNFLKTLSNGKVRTVNVMAHSLGNLVVSNAIKKDKDIGIDKYILHEAAVAANAYNIGAPTSSQLQPHAAEWGYPDDKPSDKVCRTYEREGCVYVNRAWEWPKPRWRNDKYLNNGVGDGDPWGNYFNNVVRSSVKMINTYSGEDEVLTGAYYWNLMLHRPDLSYVPSLLPGYPYICVHSWDKLPENDINREWAELSYYFGEVSLPAGITKIPDIKNLDGRLYGINSHGAFVDNYNAPQNLDRVLRCMLTCHNLKGGMARWERLERIMTQLSRLWWPLKQ